MHNSSCCSVQNAAPQLSICIVNWNTKEYLQSCLESLEPARHDTSFETIVVDNASADGSSEMVSSIFPDVRLIANSVNEGYAHGNNQALHVRKGRYVLFLNPDTVVPPGVLEKLVARMDADNRLGIITCQLRNFDDSVQNFCSGLPTFYDELFLQTGFDALYPSNILCGHREMKRFRCEVEQEIEQPPGTFILTRSSIIEKLDGFDEQFPLFFNDVDFCKRVKDAGWKILFTPEVFIYHHKSASIKKNLSFCLQEAFHMRRRYYKKYFSPFINAILDKTALFITDNRTIISNQPHIKLNKDDRILIVKSAFADHFNAFMSTASIIFSQQKIDVLSLSESIESDDGWGNCFSQAYVVSPKMQRFNWKKFDRRLCKELRSNRYKAVVFPHGTIDGAGYWNVFFMAAAIRPQHIAAYGLDQYWEVRKSHGSAWWRGKMIYCMAYLLLIIGCVIGSFRFLNRKIKDIS